MLRMESFVRPENSDGSSEIWLFLKESKVSSEQSPICRGQEQYGVHVLTHGGMIRTVRGGEGGRKSRCVCVREREIPQEEYL